MYLGVQRVIDGGGGRSVTAYLYLHGEGLSAPYQDRLRDVRWVSQVAPGQLARELHEGTAGGRRVASYLEVTGPDATDRTSLRNDETRHSFQNQYEGLFPHVLGLLRPDGGLDLVKRGGVAFKDKLTGKVLWVSPVERSAL